MEKNKNIYQIARESAGLTQEKAAELLNISVDSIRAYEGCKRIPQDKTVIKMIEIYNAQYLAYQHLKTSAEVGQKYLPNIEITQLPVAILRLQKEIKDFIDCQELLIKIGSDCRVTPDEAEDFKGIIKELDDVAEAIMCLKFSKK